MKVQSIQVGNAAEHPVVTAVNLEQLAAYVHPDEAFTAIAGWIDAFNTHQHQTNNGNGTMLPKTSAELQMTLASGMGTVLLEWNGALNGYVPAGYSALYSQPLGEPLPYGHLEFGSLIKAPNVATKGIGRLATLATLALPAAQEATAVYAYANANSLPVFVHGCAEITGVGADIMGDADLAGAFSYLEPYAGDTLVSLNPIVDALKAQL